MKQYTIARIAAWIIVAITAFAAAHASFGSFTFQSYGPGLVGNTGSVYVTDTAGSSYTVSRTPYGDYWGGYRAVSSSGNVNGGYFGYSGEYGLLYADIYNPSARGSIYRSPYGSYGGHVTVGNSHIYGLSPYNYPVYGSGYSPYAITVPNYYGNSLY